MKTNKRRIPYKRAYIGSKCGATFLSNGKRYICVPCRAKAASIGSCDEQDAMFVRVSDEDSDTYDDFVVFGWDSLCYEEFISMADFPEAWDSHQETLGTVTFLPGDVELN